MPERVGSLSSRANALRRAATSSKRPLPAIWRTESSRRVLPLRISSMTTPIWKIFSLRVRSAAANLWRNEWIMSGGTAPFTS